ncbi:nmrA-like family domain-containing protein 1 [Babylonia areolata]|uniref:nmrA-like family domain-containing protein 1 n=1 Tax=Babylonia areolata TaxID=304850 RepID=UPI003FD5B0FD
MGCGSSLDAMYDDPMPVVVFGATGLVGGAVARVLLRDRRFEVKAVTRTPTTDVARKLAEEGAIIVTADLNDPRSLTRVLEGAHAVFLITHFWEHMNKDKEITQGKNCVDAAVSTSVGHFVFYGSESPSDVTGGQCGYLESKANIEKYIKTTLIDEFFTSS